MQKTSPRRPLRSRAAPAADPRGQTDLANAKRLIALCGDRVLYCHPWRKWLVWDGARFAGDNSGAMMRHAKAVSDAVWNEAQLCDDKPARHWAAYTAGDKGIRALLSLAQSEVPVLPDELDTNPWLLNCLNGTIDLRTGTLRPHAQADRISKLCPLEYRPAAPAPTWERFLRDIFAGDEALIAFMQRLAGYALTGDVREQNLVVCWGSGSNGKTTFLEALLGTMGADFATSATSSLLMETKGQHSTELMDLFGRRLVVASETGDGRKLDEERVKRLTGGDTIKGRRMREDNWEYRPTHKLIVCTNHKPRIEGTDHAIWRRIVMVPFTQRFDGDRKDAEMPARLQAEREGILAWMVAGCLAWQKRGLDAPDAVRAATAEYRLSEDVVQAFLTECCIRGHGLAAKAGQLYEAFQTWAAAAGENVLSLRRFGEAMTERGFERKTSNGVKYLGIGLRDDREDEGGK
jgi:putative DNA primase/helicase